MQSPRRRGASRAAEPIPRRPRLVLRRNSDGYLHAAARFSGFLKPFVLIVSIAMSTIDDILIDKVYSPLSGWLEHRLGVSRWRASIECLNGSLAFYVAAVALEIAGKGPYDGIFMTMLRALVWLLVMDAVRRVAYRQAASSVGPRTARVREWIFRLVLVAVLPLSLYYAQGWHNLCYSASLMLLICHLYLKASDPPPPQPKGRLAFGGA